MGYCGYGEWEVLQDRYLLCVFMEYAATLGLIDIAYMAPERTRPVDQWGMDVFLGFLEERDDQPLPETVVAFLRQARADGEAVRQSGNAILFECRDAATAEMISKCKELSGICLRAGDVTLAVREDAMAKFRKQVRLLGLGIR